MSPTLPSKEHGVLIEDRKGKILQEIRQALKEGRSLFMVKKKKFILPEKVK